MSLSLIISNHENDVKKKAVNNTKTRKNLHTNGGIFKTNDELCPLNQGETRLIRYKNSDKTSDSFEFLSSKSELHCCKYYGQFSLENRYRRLNCFFCHFDK